MRNTICDADEAKYFLRLHQEERSEVTIRKYRHDLRVFREFVQDRPLNRELVLAYKSRLIEEYAVSSVNSMLAVANSFLRFIGRQELCVKLCKQQKKTYLSEEKEITKAEYERLVRTARRRGDVRLALLLQTIASTGIRISELRFITVEAAGAGEATVSCKAKTRSVFLPGKLRKRLLRYARDNRIESGAVFVTRTGNPMDRSNIWREMKCLCEEAGVMPGKVFPHNLRHLFARVFYAIERDIAKLADILGHTSVDTTRIYIMTTGAEHRRCIERMRLVI